ncbi:hypothetical protein FGG08_005267 [Glutinoglossum americanum]|uniref:Uncharacterized protein n=1 Tax=Glutinoglossum americanum TaxID=1670608 RepID=A0A9P8I9R3_9PEZI|nr:hypothetical protein FGG08_005267 [Glutinoglossum americanum]
MADKPNGSNGTQPNSPTGRPTRQRQRVIRSGFVDTVESLNQIVELDDSDSEVDDPTISGGGRRKPTKSRKALLKRTPTKPPPLEPILAALGIADQPISKKTPPKPVATIVSYASGIVPVTVNCASVKLAINVPAGQKFPILLDFNLHKLKYHIEKGKVYRLKTADQWVILNAEFGSGMRQEHLLNVEALLDVAGIRTEVSKDGSIVVDVDYLNNIASLNKDFRLVNPEVVIRTQERAVNTPKGFLDLPPEIRNMVYSLLFVSENRRVNFCGVGESETIGDRTVLVRLSSAFLATCRQVNMEGGAVLYGTNKFVFERSFSLRGRWFEARWKQVGYEDVARFFLTIGTYNLSNLRSVVFYLEDGNLDHANEWTLNDRRFIYDQNLLQCFQILGTRCKSLEALEIHLNPRRKICNKDVMFLESLKCIRDLKCLLFKDRHPHAVLRPFPYKMDDSVYMECQRAMLCARAQLETDGLVTDERERDKLRSRARYEDAIYEQLFGPKSWMDYKYH